MKRIFSSPVAALAAGLLLRLFFVLQLPAGSGDSVIYEQIAENWLKHHSYAMTVAGQYLPVDLRMPGYPAFLALIYALTGKVGETARLPLMLAQIFVDLLTCLVIASLAAVLSFFAALRTDSRRIFTIALWLAALCPFTANYTAVPLTEVFAIFFTALAFLFLSQLFLAIAGVRWYAAGIAPRVGNSPAALGALAGLTVGLGTLFRPETPLLLIVAIPVLSWFFFRQEKRRGLLPTVLLMGLACILPLLPWGVRNSITLHKIQFLAPKNAMLPGEMDPVGFIAWEKTWLYRFRDCYLVPWKLNDEVINLDDIPSNAFDNPREKERVAALLEQYNDDLTLTAEEDAAFAQLARERTSRHPLRTYLWLPARRFVRIWFTPRIELLPVSGNVFPLSIMWDEDPVDQRVTLGLFLLNIFYVSLGIWGALCLWKNRAARPAVVLIALYILIRTVFLSTLETPEPRYVLVCFPLLIALAAQSSARSGKPA
ncbi:MAG: hypothetical protein PVS2B2_16290 [Candidatus Acidiferrum sp.]